VLGVGNYGFVVEGRRPATVEKIVSVEEYQNVPEAAIQRESSRHCCHVPPVHDWYVCDDEQCPCFANVRYAELPTTIGGIEVEQDSWVGIDGGRVIAPCGTGPAPPEELEQLQLLDKPSHCHIITQRIDGVSLEEYAVGCSQRRMRLVCLQVFNALATLQAACPGFRHNDLHAANVLVSQADGKRSLAYRNTGQNVFLRHGDPVVHIIDFGFASCMATPSPMVRASAEAPPFEAHGICDQHCPQFDMHRFATGVLPYLRANKRVSGDGELKRLLCACAKGETELGAELQVQLRRRADAVGLTSIDGCAVAYGDLTPARCCAAQCFASLWSPCQFG